MRPVDSAQEPCLSPPLALCNPLRGSRICIKLDRETMTRSKGRYEIKRSRFRRSCFLHATHLENPMVYQLIRLGKTAPFAYGQE